MPLDARQAFKAAFLARCAEDGLDTEATRRRWSEPQ